MGRRDAVKRLVIAVPYVPLYAFILYPVSLVIGLFLGAAAAIWEALTGNRPGWAPETAGRVWSWPSDNMHYLMSGDGEFDWLP